MRTRLLRSGGIRLACVLALLATGGTARSGDSSQRHGTGSLIRGFQHGSVRLGGRVEIDWQAGELLWHRMVADPSLWKHFEETRRGGPGSWLSPAETCTTETSTQYLETRGRPCAAACVGDDALAVATEGPSGELVIELWTLRWPEEMPELDPATHRVALVEPELSEVEVVVDERRLVEGRPAEAPRRRGPIRSLIAMPRERGRAASLLALFEDPQELATIDLATGTIEPLASSDGHAGSLGYVPMLAETRFANLSLDVDPAEGFAYRVSPRIRCMFGTCWPELRLVDADRDGRIDRWRRSTLGEGMKLDRIP